MAVPNWPADVPYAPDLNSVQQIKRSLDPIKTEMEGGNMRLRARPGDNVGTLSQTVRMNGTELASLIAWIKNTIGGGTGRFNLSVRLDTGFATKVCQFTAVPTYQPIGAQRYDVGMQLRVYGL